MQKRPSLWWYLSSRVLVTTIIMFVLLTIVELSFASWLERKEMKQRIDDANQIYATGVDQFLTSLTHQIESIAKNSILVNGLFDSTGRDNYLPLYLETVGIFGRTDIAIQLVDFQGAAIHANFFGKNQNFPQADLWLDMVINNSQRWLQWHRDGLIIVEPVLNRGFAEGAILVFIDAAVLSEGFANINPGFSHEIRMLSGELLYANNALDQLSEAKFHNNNIRVESNPKQLNHFQLEVVLHRLYPAYALSSSAFLPLVILSIALLAISIVSILSISVRKVNETVARLSQAIEQVIQSQDLHARVDTYNSPQELADLGDLFNLMVAKLQATTTSRNEINAIIQCMGESVFVCDLAMNVTLTNQPDKTLVNARSIVGAEPDHEIFDEHTEVVEFEQKANDRLILWRRWPLVVDNEKEGWILTGSDISDIHAAQEQLRLLEMAIDSSSNGIVIVDATEANEPIVFANRSFTEITGFELSEVLGKKCDFLQGEHTQPETRQKIRSAITHHTPVMVEILNYRKNGEPFWNQLSIDPVFNQQGDVSHFLGVLIDISDVVAAREELKIAKTSAESAAKAKSEFLATMSHEIRTPMNGVLGMLGVLLNTGLNDEQKHRARIAQSSAQSLLVLINDILDFSKIEAGKLELESMSFNPRFMFGELAEVMAHQAQDKGLELILDVTGIEASEIMGDSGRIRQIVTNLISNAIKFTAEGEVLVQVGLFTEGEHWRMVGRVVDSGIGIPQEKTAKLFDAFSQVDASTTREYGGTGLGLAIVRLLCELMNGSIRVMSEVGRGSVFEFELQVEASPGWQEVKPPLDISDKRILIVDANQTNLDVLRGQLKHWGAKVEYAVDVESGKDLLNAKRITPMRIFDLAIVDLKLPNEGAKKLAEYIQSEEAYSDMKVVGMSPIGEFSPESMQDEFKFNAYFPKPATTQDFFTTLTVLSDASDDQVRKAELISRLELHQNTLANFAHSKHSSSLKRILIVDDNHINQEVALGILEGFGLSAECADDGKQALHKLSVAPADNPFTFVMMDCQMPVMDGYQASQEIRSGMAGERYIDTPILAMTANAMSGAKERCLEAGMSDYIAKPVDPMLLNQKLKIWSANQADDDLEQSATNAESLPADNLAEEQNRVTQQIASVQSENNLPIWDRQGFLNRIGHNNNLADKIVSMYLKEQTQRLYDLQQAYQSQNYSAVQAAAHTIKGVCSNLNASQTEKAAADVEQAVKTHHIEGLKQKVDALVTAETELVALFEQQLKAQQPPKASPEASEFTSLANVTPYLETLYSALKQHEFIDSQDYEILLKPCGDAQLSKKLVELFQRVEQFENDAALELLGTLSTEWSFALNEHQGRGE